MKSFALAALMGAVATAMETAPIWEFFDYLARHNKQYTSDAELNLRYIRWAEIDEHIKNHNASGSMYRAGHNKFSDWSFAEYKALMGYRKGPEAPVKEVAVFEPANSDGINWIDLGGVTPIKDQGNCGSCWAFSTTGSLEGAHFAATGKLLSFSEQQLVDCAYVTLGYGNYGCNGGLQDYAYNYYEDGHNAELESVYPYFSGDTSKKGDCQYDSASTTAVTVSTYKAVTPYSPE